jgi:hypothetical protein
MYFVPTSPSSGEESSYNRLAVAFVFGARTFNWAWRFDATPSIWPRVRMLIDGAVATGWVSNVGGIYTFPVAAENGHHVADFEFEAPVGAQVLRKPFVVNDTSGPLPAALQRPWVAPIRIESPPASMLPARVDYPPAEPPFAATMKARTVTPYTQRHFLSTYAGGTPSQLWARRWTFHTRPAMARRFWKTLKGDAIVVPEQKYPYDNAISIGSYTAGLVPPVALQRDGPRNVGCLGYVAKLALRRGGKGVYFLETGGRVGHMQFAASDPAPGGGLTRGEGYINTFAGWRTTGLRVWQGGEAGHEFVGDFSRVPGVKRMHEPWGFAIAFRKADGALDNRDGLDLWVTDTLNHRVLYLDVWAQHPDVSAMTGRPSVAQFPPPGYSTPATRGTTQVVPFAGSTNQTPSALCNEPWDCEVRTQDGKLYWTNFAGDSICRANLDGSGAEVFIGFAAPKTNAQLGIGTRLGPSSTPIATLRANHMQAGTRTTATFTRPQAIAFDAAGNLFFICRYLYAILKYDFATDQVSVFCQIAPAAMAGFNAGGINVGGSSSVNDCAMAIDVDGSCGPAGDILVSLWAGPSVFRIAATGQMLGGRAVNLSSNTLRNGPWDQVDYPNYAWGIAIQEGRIVWAGNDSGNQFVELTKRLASDPAPSVAAINRGAQSFHSRFLHTHGKDGYGELGHPNVERMGSWTDSQISTYFMALGVPAAELADLTTWVRWMCVDYDYTSDTTPPAPPTSDLALTSVVFS